MKIQSKKLLSVFLALAMVFAMLPMSVFAEDDDASGICGDNLTWTLVDGVLTISGTGEMYDYDYSGNFAPWLSYDLGTITSVVIEDGVTSIGDSAFEYFNYGFTFSIMIGDTVKTIGDYAFCECGFTSIELPNSVTSIGAGAFACSSLQSITIPNSVTSIGDDAFVSCSLTSIDIPESVTNIGDNAFGVSSEHGYADLTEINVSENNKYYSSIDGVLFNKDQTEIICYPTDKSGTSYTIPDGVTSIGDNAFACCYNLENVKIPNGVTSIGDYAFYNCNSLTSVSIPDSVTSIGDYAFEDCTSLTSVTIPDSVTSIGDYAFNYCSSLTSVNVDSNNKYYTSSNSVLFNKDKTELICYPSGKSDASYIIPDSVESISDWAFCNCDSLTSVTIGNSVTSICSYAFAWCTSLTSVTISDSVTSIGGYAFRSCTSLTDVYYGGSQEEWDAIAIAEEGNEYLLSAYLHTNEEDDEDLDKTDDSDDEDKIDYTWIFEEDNFCFTNNSSYFGSGSYYIEDEMFYDYLATLDNGQIARTANEFGKYSSMLYTYEDEEYTRLRNFLKNNLRSWSGSCYGMSLVSALIKIGNLSAEDLGAATTYELAALDSDENSTLESIINLYHISQMTSSIATTEYNDFAVIMKNMWVMAKNMGTEYQPFLVCLESSEGSHAVVCYGAETGEFSVGHLWWKEEYTMRLLIYDPNSDEEEYIYISDDFSSAETTCDDSLLIDEFDIFGYIYVQQTTDLDIPHYVYLDIDNTLLSQYTIYSSDGSYIEVSNGNISDGTIDNASIEWPINMLADNEEIESENQVYTVYLPDDSDYYQIVPAEGETLDALLTYDDFSIAVSGTAESAIIYADGTVEITGAEGDLAIDVTLNNSEFDFVSIVGNADGDVTVPVSDESITITGDLSDYTVENMNRDCETTIVYVEGDTDVKAIMNDETVTAYVDLDDDGDYETELAHTHYYVYTDNGDGTHTATCIGGDDEYTEAHTYVDGICTACGVEEVVGDNSDDDDSADIITPITPTTDDNSGDSDDTTTTTAAPTTTTTTTTTTAADDSSDATTTTTTTASGETTTTTTATTSDSPTTGDDFSAAPLVCLMFFSLIAGAVALSFERRRLYNFD